MGAHGTQGNAGSPSRTAIVVDLRGAPADRYTGRLRAMGASPGADDGRRDADRHEPVTDRILAAWFGVRSESVGEGSGAAPASGRGGGETPRP